MGIDPEDLPDESPARCNQARSFRADRSRYQTYLRIVGDSPVDQLPDLGQYL